MHPNLTCCICLDDMTKDTAVVALPCGHCFGEKCIEECLLSGSTKCPLCQKTYRHTRVRTLYLPLEEDCDKTYKEKYDKLVEKTSDLTKHYEVLKDLCDMTASNAPIIRRVNDLVNQMAITREEMKETATMGKGPNQIKNPAALEPKQKKKGKLCKLFAGMKL